MSDRTPIIRATVKEEQTDLAKTDIAFFLDGNQKGAFAYDASTDRLSFTPGSRLALGRHTVKVVATDEQGLQTAESWRFTVE